MTDINEKETIVYFIHGLRKAKAAAKELAAVNQQQLWNSIARNLDQLLVNAEKLYNAKPLTRMQTLTMTNQMMPEIKDAGGKSKVIH